MEFIKSAETDIHKYLTTYFTKWFHVEPEIKSDCARYRIDLILQHKLMPGIQFGIEVKGSDEKKGKELSEWLLQAQKYSYCRFNGQATTIFTAPQISYLFLNEGVHMHQHNVLKADMIALQNNVNTFLYGAFNVGELQKYSDYKGRTQMRLVINSCKLWSSERPDFIDLKNYNRLCPTRIQ